MADIHGSPAAAPQMPAAPNSGPAPAPYGGMDLSPEPPGYAADLGPLTDTGANVMSSVTNLGTTESPAAHDVDAGTVDAPYYPGPLAPIDAMGDADAGGRDDVAGTVGGAVAAAEARFREHESDTYAMGSQIGDGLALLPVDSNPAVGDNSPWGPFPDGQPPSGSYA